MPSSDFVGGHKRSHRWTLKSREYLTRRHRWTTTSAPTPRPTPSPQSRPSPSLLDNQTSSTSSVQETSLRNRAASPDEITESSPAAELTLDETADFWVRLQAQVRHFLSDQVTPIRLASHVAVLAVALVVLFVSRMELPEWQFSLGDLPRSSALFAETVNPSLPAEELTNPLAAAEVAEAFRRAVVLSANTQEALAQPVTAPAPMTQAETQAAGTNAPRTAIETYVVKPGDTVMGIAAKYGLQPDTILWANPALERNPDLLRVGDRLVILPVDGVLHVVQPGDTLFGIAAKYKVTPEEIASYPLNGMESIDTPLTVGKQLIVPHGEKPYVPQQVLAYNGPIPQGARQGTGTFGWPTNGYITQGFWNGHRAIDIGAWEGTPVLAADSGYVVLARSGGWNWGYGNVVMIDHGNGYLTVYAHMRSLYVRQGESVAKGQQIGAVGNTGNSTGPHLHFEVRYQGVNRNPLAYLP